MQRLIQKLPGYNAESKEWQAISALGAGVLGGIVASTPVENIILAQQLHRSGPLETVGKLLNQSITRPFVGMPELMMREAGFAGVMLWGNKAAIEFTREKTKSEPLAKLAGLAVCLSGAAATHPFDTVATKKQKANGTLTSRVAWTSIYQAEGFQGFLRGLSGRCILFTGCATIIPWVHERILTLTKQF